MNDDEPDDGIDEDGGRGDHVKDSKAAVRGNDDLEEYLREEGREAGYESSPDDNYEENELF